ncbi:MAG: recombination protein RecR, partial [Campylobacterales bacterium]|nr:recombination protein RecR [Campylobacterales bacterium]
MRRELEKFFNLVDALETLPTIGKKSALRLAYNMISKDNLNALKIAHAIEDAIKHIKHCTKCNFLSENELCEICVNDFRDKSTLCIVQSPKDVFIIEESKRYNGLYFVLEELTEENISKLYQNCTEEATKEIIFAFTPNIENEALMLYIEDKLKNLDINFTKIAQGVPTGVGLDCIDSLS